MVALISDLNESIDHIGIHLYDEKLGCAILLKRRISSHKKSN